VHGRILLGVAAWLAGASAATGGSLLAVSMLGQGMTPGSGEQQSVATVNHALAKEAAERATAMPGLGVSPRRAASPRRAVSPKAARIASPSRVARHRAASPAARNSAPPSPSAPGGTVLTSQGGTLVASCAGARAYLMSWSPQQGFGSTDVIRGPAASARVTFTGGQLTVTMVVSCDSGAPTATATAVSTGSSATSNWAGDGE
jgi:hypothetical protein